MTFPQPHPTARRPRPFLLLPALVTALIAALLLPATAARAATGETLGTPVHLQVTAATEYGDTVLVSGSTAELGAWDPAKAVPLTTDARSYPTWSVDLLLPPGGQLTYKYLKRTAAGTLEWEAIPDRSVYLSGTGGETTLTDRWNVTGEHPLTAVFTVRATTTWGQSLYVSGDLAELGAWDPAKAVPLSTSYAVYPEWTGIVSLPPNTAVRYKLLKKDADGTVTWEDGPNHATVTPPTGTLVLHDGWR
ncbi:carbohydrate-binding module family 20 domain-containing protein [Streptomyces sp. NRRL B-24484]|uniref:carbohydrate-binding module family 20 domain-containing protein n=1 Tax=Streptomyces sp. NRRL B-24484 TaxID=1463833 RepID=UPI0004C041A6|nr:carbohydrate-binding module family 20 domain-containing protein [Streptomyces sp. NRRL B-24484]